MVNSLRRGGVPWLVAGLWAAVGAVGDDRPGRPPVELGGGLPAPFVPKTPRTAAERERIEAFKDYAAARSLEDRRRYREAIATLEEALKKAPDDPAILRRLAQTNFRLGRVEPGVASARRALAADPDDAETLNLLIEFYLQKGDGPAIDALLKRVLANDRIAPDSPGRLLALRMQGDLNADILGRPDRAADAYARLYEALTDRTINRLSFADHRRIFRGPEAAAFLKMGEALLRAKRYDLAAEALQRGLAYDPENAVIPRLLAEARLRQGRETEALEVLEPYLRRQPAGREPFDLLEQILAKLGRRGEILPRLEAAAKADPKNLALQFLLVEHYRAAGQEAKAETLLRGLLANQGDPQVFGALAASLRKEKKTGELLAVLADALDKEGGLEAVQPQINAIIDDPAEADRLLDAGLKRLADQPVGRADNLFKLLAHIANRAKRTEKLVALDRLALKRDPSPINYRELAFDLLYHGRYDDAIRAFEDLFAKHPVQKTAENLNGLARCRLLSGQADAALETARQARKLAPDDPDTLLLIAMLLGRVGKSDEAIAAYQEILKKFPDNEKIENLARSGLSSIYVDREEFAKGEAELETLLAKDPDDPGVNNDLGYLYADRNKNLEKAEAMIRKAVEAVPDNGSYLDSLGWVLYRRGKLREAVEPLEKAAKDATTPDATIFDHLGEVYFRLKQFDKARSAWEKAEALAAKAHPPDKRLADIRKKLDALKRQAAATPTPGGDQP